MKFLKKFQKLIPLLFLGEVISALVFAVALISMMLGKSIPSDILSDISGIMTTCALGLWLCCAVAEL